MDFIKSRWSSTSFNNVQVNQSQPIDTSCNSVNYNARPNPQNPIIIATHHPTQISNIREVRNPQLKASEMISPTDSFHSVGSTFHNDNKDGKVNLAFNENSSEINNQQHHQPSQSNARHPQNQWVEVPPLDDSFHSIAFIIFLITKDYKT